MSSNELTTREDAFIHNLIRGMPVKDAAIEAGFSDGMYGYALRKRLAKQIIDAAQDYLSMHSVKAALKIVESVDTTEPINPLQLQAANSLLDRVGIIKKEPNTGIAIKANIFILPEKKPSEIIIENES